MLLARSVHYFVPVMGRDPGWLVRPRRGEGEEEEVQVISGYYVGQVQGQLFGVRMHNVFCVVQVVLSIQYHPPSGSTAHI